MRRTAAPLLLTLVAGLAVASPDPCALVKPSDLQAITAGASVGSGELTKQPEIGTAICSYHWGPGGHAASGRFILHVTVSEGSKVFPGLDSQTIRQGLLDMTKQPGANAVVIPGVGDAAIFESVTPIRANTTAYVKGMVLKVDLDGPDGRTKKDPVIELLKALAARLEPTRS